MRSRPHVICTRLNEDEYAIYQRILRKVRREFTGINNKSDAFRKALLVIDETLKQEAFELFYQYSLDV